jgi:hypothetical protein
MENNEKNNAQSNGNSRKSGRVPTGPSLASPGTKMPDAWAPGANQHD